MHAYILFPFPGPGKEEIVRTDLRDKMIQETNKPVQYLGTQEIFFKERPFPGD